MSIFSTGLVSAGLLQNKSTSLPSIDKSWNPPTLPSLTNDIPGFQVQFELTGVANSVATFKSFSGLTVSRAVDPLDVGGQNDYSLEFPGRVSYGHIILKSGISVSRYFWDWMVRGEFDGYALAHNFTLSQYDPTINNTIKTWNFINGYPVKYAIESIVKVDRSTNVIETLEISFDTFALA
jgi:phage tail-like protein